MGVLVERASALLSGLSASGQAGGVMDTRACRNYGFLHHATQAHSANFTHQGSFDGSAWVNIGTYTASPTTGTAQTVGYFPYQRAVINLVYSGSNLTAAPFVHLSPGLM